MISERVRCPHCGRIIGSHSRRYSRHLYGDDYCPLSEQPLPAGGFDPRAYTQRARTVTTLAAQLRDLDPQLVYDYLNAQTRHELIQLAAVAIAAIPTDHCLTDVFAWVTDLPEAAA